MVKDLNPYDLRDKRTIWFLGRMSVASQREILDDKLYSGGSGGSSASKSRVDKFSKIVKSVISGESKDEINKMLELDTLDNSIENSRANPDLDMEVAYFQTGNPVLVPGSDFGWEGLSETFKQATDAVINNEYGISERNRYFDIHVLKPVKTVSQEDAYEVTFAPNYNLNYDKFGKLDTTDNFQKTYVTGEVGDRFLRQNLKALRVNDECQVDILNMIHDGGIPNTPDALTAIRMMDESHRSVSPDMTFEAWFKDDVDSGNLGLDMDIIANSSVSGDYDISSEDLSKKFDNSISGLSGLIMEKNVGSFGHSETEYIVNLDSVDFDVNLVFGAERNASFRRFISEAQNGLSIGEDVLTHNKAKVSQSSTTKSHSHSKLDSFKAWGASLLD